MELGILEAVACKDNNPAQAAEIKAEVDLDYRKAKTAVVRCKTQQEFGVAAQPLRLFTAVRGARAAGLALVS